MTGLCETKASKSENPIDNQIESTPQVIIDQYLSGLRRFRVDVLGFVQAEVVRLDSEEDRESEGDIARASPASPSLNLCGIRTQISAA